MGKTMIAPKMTDGQIENAVNKLRDAMRKHRSEVASEVTQQVLGVPNIGMAMYAAFRELAENPSHSIVRKVKVDRDRTPQQALDATGRLQYVDRKVVEDMPKGEGNKVKVVFFKPDFSSRSVMTDDELEQELELRGLIPADPFTLAAINEADPGFTDTRPHGTHWKDDEGHWCCASFDLWRGKPAVNVGRLNREWLSYWWFAGIRK